MARTESKMGLRVWDLPADPYDHNQLASNFMKIGLHDHTPNRGVQIPTEGIYDGAVTTAKLNDGAVTSAKLNAAVLASINTLVPTGLMLPHAGSSAPAGFVLANGQLLDGTLAANLPLWTLIGLTYGGTAQAAFRVPDTRGNVIVGFKSGTYVLGQTGGAESIALSTSQIPSHNHGGATGTGVSGNPNISLNHDHAPNGGIGEFLDTLGVNPTTALGTGGFTTSPTTGPVRGASNPGGTNLTHTHTVPALSISSQGGGTAHENRQPFVVTNYVIKL